MFFRSSFLSTTLAEAGESRPVGDDATQGRAGKVLTITPGSSRWVVFLHFYCLPNRAFQRKILRTQGGG